MQTSCRNCVFAKYKLGKMEGSNIDWNESVTKNDIQYGCELSRLERFDINGGIKRVFSDIIWGHEAKLLNAPEADKFADGESLLYEFEESLDEIRGTHADWPVRFIKVAETKDFEEKRKYYYNIQRFCITCRDKNSDWAKQIPQDKWLETVLEDIKLRHTIVVYYHTNNSIEQLDEFIQSCLSQTLLPEELLILNSAGIQTQVEISNHCDKLELWDKLRYKTILILQPKDNRETLNEIIKKHEGTYFSKFRLPYKVPTNFVNSIHTALNERLERFVMLTSDNGQGFTIQSSLFNMLGGNKDIKLKEDEATKTSVVLFNIEDKVKFLAKENKEDYLVKKLEEVVN